MDSFESSQLLKILSENNIKNITSNSTKVEQDGAFFAIKGSCGDGHDYIKQAAENGAKLIVYDQSYKENLADIIAQFPTLIFHGTSDVRLALAHAAKMLYNKQPKYLVAITGTSGKSSIAHFTRQIWQYCGKKAAYIGTLGVSDIENNDAKTLTTPDVVDLHNYLHQLANKGFDHVIIEASSHGIEQKRLAGLNFCAAGFSNLGHDHLDYHDNLESYFNAKMLLFTQYLPPISSAIIFADTEYGKRAIEQIAKHNQNIRTVGKQGNFIKLLAIENNTQGRCDIKLEVSSKIYEVNFPLIGEFQIYNAILSLAFVLSIGDVDTELAIEALSKLQPVQGRLELIASSENNVNIFVDYAHKPEALESLLNSVASFTKGRIILVFGCGGNRDKAKRAIMGSIAEKLADIVIVTDDNPRYEEMAEIRADILQGMNNAIEIEGRNKAIKYAINIAESGDNVVIAGKGHETGQEIKGELFHFSDKEEILKILETKKQLNPLWTALELQQAIKGEYIGQWDKGFTKVSIDSRTIEPGAIFFAIKGSNFNGHQFVGQAFEKGARLAVIDKKNLSLDADLQNLLKHNKPLLIVEDVLQALEDLAKSARLRSKAKIIAVTGSVGKTTAKELLRSIFSCYGTAYANLASYNNHWGVPLTLANMDREVEYAIFELGMNHCGEIEHLSSLVLPDITVITTIAPAHIGNFRDINEIALAKAEIYKLQNKNGLALVNSDDGYQAILENRAREAGIEHIRSFGRAQSAYCRIISQEKIAIGDKIYQIKTQASSAGIAHNIALSLAVLDFLKLDITSSLKAIELFNDLPGRGLKHHLAVPGGSITLIDDSYNANPVSMRASLERLGKLTLNNKDSRKIAIIGDMLELGDDAKKLHESLADLFINSDIKLVYLIGDQMSYLRDRLSHNLNNAQKLYWAKDVEGIKAKIIADILPGDCLMAKSSNSIRTSEIVKELLQKYYSI